MTWSLQMLQIKVLLKGAQTPIVPLYRTHRISEQKMLRLYKIILPTNAPFIKT